MASRSALAPVLFALVLAAHAGPAAARSDDGPGDTPTTTTTAPAATTTTLPDDFLTLYPEWSDDYYQYLDPGTHESGLPSTGSNMGVLGFLSSFSVVVGTGISFGAGSRARRR